MDSPDMKELMDLGNAISLNWAETTLGFAERTQDVMFEMFVIM